MSCCQSRCDKDIAALMAASGACHWGIARSGTVDEQELTAYSRWISEGNAAGMDYLSRNEGIRSNPANLLEGTKSVISAAFVYGDKDSDPKLPIASYALGKDYHFVLKERLRQVVELFESRGEKARICVDSAPLAERYWAVKAGVGRIGMNCQIYVPGAGCKVFLVTILTTAELEESGRSDGKSYFREGCRNCRKCVAICPTGALKGNGTIDSRLCLNYLTIEHRGELPEGTDLHGSLFGCERCIDICPAPRSKPTAIEDLAPDPRVLELDVQTLNSMSSSAFNRKFRFSPLSRAGLKGLQRNLMKIGKKMANHQGK
ncbi:MAG: DUF1730 domain-containing protein [Bacteroides sp.]|nr:DUF1730 domain-containing protein [Bacteroides sp.]